MAQFQPIGYVMVDLLLTVVRCGYHGGMRRRAAVRSSMAALATFLGAAAAGAADTPYVTRGPLCPLPHSPFFRELATPAELVCKLDADDDGLDDLIENTIAECFMPTFRFDTAENALRTFPAPPGTDPSKVATQEPRALYSVVPGDASKAFCEGGHHSVPLSLGP